MTFIPLVLLWWTLILGDLIAGSQTSRDETKDLIVSPRRCEKKL
jgi:hypothetical protein